jgi:hypothetical protein
MISGRGGNLKTDIHSHRLETAEGELVSSSWWPLDCLRSLGRVASIAAGGPAPHPPQQHAEYRGFRILTTGRDGVYFAHITHHGGQPIRAARQIRQQIDMARFDSHEEAAQHARFVIASGAFTHLVRDTGFAGPRASQ